MAGKPRLLRITTVPVSLKLLLNGQLKFMEQQGFEVLGVSADGPEVNDLKSEGIQHQVVNMTRKITPWKDLMALISLIKIIRKFRPDIVHSHTPKAGLLAMIAAWICRVPIRLHTIAGLPLMEEKGLKRTMLVVTERITYRMATKVFVNSAGLKDFIHNSGISRTPLNIIGKGSSNGIDTSYFAPSRELAEKGRSLRIKFAIPDDAILFCFAGRIVTDKGVNELLQSFVELRREIKCNLVLLGAMEEKLDPLKPENMDLLTEKDSGIICAGFQNDIRPWLAASNVFVFPSYREGFPNVLMQAVCMNIPCIATDINGCNEIIENGNTGILVPPKDTQSLLQEMRNLALNPEMRSRLAKNARAYIVGHFDRTYIWTSLLEEYQNQLEFVRNHH